MMLFLVTGTMTKSVPVHDWSLAMWWS